MNKIPILFESQKLLNKYFPRVTAKQNLDSDHSTTALILSV